MKVQLNTIFTSVGCALVLLLCASISSVAQGKSDGVKIIMIDPGHGGKDPGTVNGDIYEKDINLAVSLMLGEMIKKNLPDVKVLYTREKDEFVELYKRGEMANKAGANLFLSIHVNAVNPGKSNPTGALTLVMGPGNADKNLDVAMRENDVIVYEDNYQTNYEGYIPNSAESFIIFSLMQYVNIDQSMEFANLIQKSYKKSTPMPDLGARQQNILVLWRTAMPSVLTELGFLSNAADRKVLASKDGQKKMATALFNAFSEYKSKVEGNSKPILLEVPGASSGGGEIASGESKKQIIYRVQICNSSRKLGRNGTLLKNYKDMVITERVVGEVYKYYVGESLNYEDAVALQAKVRATTADAFVVAFDGDTQIGVAEARKITK